MNELINLLKSDPNVANAYGAVGSAVAAFLALITSAISMCISIKALSIQRKHNELSVRPFAEVMVADFESSLRIKLANNGSGPLIINGITISNGHIERNSLIDWMPELPRDRLWTAFTGNLQNRIILAGRDLTLLELTEVEGELHFNESREIVRAALAPLTISVNYSDVYENEFSPYQKDLSWFGRTL